MVDSTPSLSEFASEYYNSRLDVCERHKRQVLYTVDQLNSFATEITASDLSEELVGRFLSSLSCSPATVDGKRSCLLAVWRAAWEAGLADRPPRAKLIPKPRVPDQIPEAYTLAEMRAILQAAAILEGTTEGIPSAGFWGSLIRVAYETGGRVGAIMRTRSEDFDERAGWLILRGSNDKTGKTHFFTLTRETTEAISLTSPCGRLFLWPWSKSQCWLSRQLVRLILIPAGVRYGRGRGGVFHKFRRTAGTLCEANGGDGARLLGNTRAVFERHYLDGRLAGNGQSQFLPRL